MVDVKAGAAWLCRPEGPGLEDILLPVQLGNDNEEELWQLHAEDTDRAGGVLLQRAEDGAPCVLTLLCSPPAAIGRLLLLSEAPTMEVYRGGGEYCGTARGLREGGPQTHRVDGGPLYRKQLTLERPSSACELKLLSLGGRSSVRLARLAVGLRRLVPGPERPPGIGIDLQQVQSLVQEMGSGLSPGAQGLMDMVQAQQKNQSGALGGFLPLLMGGGAFSALARGVGVAPAAPRDQPPSADRTPPEAWPQSGAMSEGSSSPDLPSSDLLSSSSSSSETGVALSPAHLALSPAHLAQVMSQLLRAPAGGEAGGELLPLLQGVCSQVAQRRLDEAAERHKTRVNGWELDPAMERRLEEMERRLKEHLDRRLDALEQKLQDLLSLSGPQQPMGAQQPAALSPQPMGGRLEAAAPP